VAGPVGAAAGALLGNMLEEQIRGRLNLKLRYLPIPRGDGDRKRYKVVGGSSGIDWGDLYSRHSNRLTAANLAGPDPDVIGDDLELCVFVTHEKTGCTGAVYRSLVKKTIAVSFRGTCAPKDLVTDASILQTPWVRGAKEGEDGVLMVHAGFRESLDSISRRMKELVIAAVGPDESIIDYDIMITGHSLGGALATLFAADVGEYGFDAGRGLPQEAPSEPWFGRLAKTLASGKSVTKRLSAPPRPRSLKLYSFGSPRVGDAGFVRKFGTLIGKKGGLDDAYRVVNDADVVARMPRSFDGLILGKVDYDHCGPTALVAAPKNALEEIIDAADGTGVEEVNVDGVDSIIIPTKPTFWVEGESDDSKCPVRDGSALVNPLTKGALLGDIYSELKTVSDSSEEEDSLPEEKLDLGNAAEYATKAAKIAGKMSLKVTERLQKLSASDVTSVLGIDKNYAEREATLFQSILKGDAVFHHLEPQYFAGMAQACGLNYVVDPESMLKEGDKKS